MQYSRLINIFLLCLLSACNSNNQENGIVFLKSTIKDSVSVELKNESQSSVSQNNLEAETNIDENNQEAVKTEELDLKRQLVRLPHTINTDVSEYYPCPLPDGKLLFSAMDRTGYFDYKIDYTVTQSAGGEDGFISSVSDGLPEDALPLKNGLNTNSHECVTYVLKNGDYLMVANYKENLNNSSSDAGMSTPDLFFGRINTGRVTHLPEPINSIYGEYDGVLVDGENTMIFVSDRPGGIGEYKKKGWLWNNNLWGNTDIYVSSKVDGEWTAPINLGKIINTPYAERTPWLSQDGLTLYLSTNAYSEGRNDLDIFKFTRKNKNSWTQWEGPVKVKDVCSAGDDWCYKIDVNSGNCYFSRSLKLKYKTSMPAREGDAYVRETGWRPGYTIYGAQSAALRRDYQMDIYIIPATSKPIITLPDLLFDIASYKFKNESYKSLERLVDYIELNTNKSIEIYGHSDNTGTDEFNKLLSENRANELKKFLVDNGVDEDKIKTFGCGSQKPVLPNNTLANRQKNRRVEIYFK